VCSEQLLAHSKHWTLVVIVGVIILVIITVLIQLQQE
jgi:low affinity Fe/Cu permease